MNKKLECFLKIPSQSQCTSVGLLLLRLVVGVAFMMHGWGKIQTPMSWMPPDAPIPGFLQLLAAVSEFGGGLALILGLLTRLASLGIACTMMVATLMHAVVMKDPFINPAGGGSFELPLVFLIIAILFILAGPGKYSLDKKVFNEQ